MIESRLVDYLRNDEELSSLLAKYNEKPAIFQQMIPDENDAAWAGEQFSRICYSIISQSSPDRKTAGTLLIDITCSEDSTPYEPIEAAIRRLVDGCFFDSDDGTIVAACWQRSDGFTTSGNGTQGSNDHTAYGVTITFDLMAFPTQQVTGMDPCGCISDWTRKTFSNARLITSGAISEGAWKPTDEEPAVYWHLVSTQQDPSMLKYDSWSVTWMQAVLRCHVFSETPQVRNDIIKQMAEKAYPETKIPFPDGSPLLVQRFQANSTWDALKTGQIMLIASYGILRIPERTPISNISINQGG